MYIQLQHVKKRTTNLIFDCELQINLRQFSLAIQFVTRSAINFQGGNGDANPSGHLNLETVIFTVPPISAQPSPDTQSWAWLRTYFVLYEAQSPSRLIITVMVKLLTSPKVDFIWDCRATAEPGPRLTSSPLFHAFPTI